MFVYENITYMTYNKNMNKWQKWFERKKNHCDNLNFSILTSGCLNNVTKAV